MLRTNTNTTKYTHNKENERQQNKMKSLHEQLENLIKKRKRK